jgi:hypothetical protein
MRLLLARLLCLMLTGSSLCAIATCYRPDVAVRNRPSAGERPRWFLEATPAAVSPKKPPIDAGVDAIVPLPPLPDAAVPILKDAATPMSR